MNPAHHLPISEGRHRNGKPTAGDSPAMKLHEVEASPTESRQAPSPLDEEIATAEAAYTLMRVADTCLRVGADHLLLGLGFSSSHIADLRRSAGSGGGYPAVAMRNIKQTLRTLRQASDGES